MPTPGPAPKLTTLCSYYGQWIERKVPPLVRLSTAKRHRRCFEAIVLPELGAALFQEITKGRLGSVPRQAAAWEDATRNDAHHQGCSQHLTGIFDLYGATRKEKVMRICSHAWIGHERIAANPIPLTPMSATPFWHGPRATSLTGVRSSFFCFGLVSATAKRLRCDGMTSI
jgi:hypothetical protein